MQAFERINNLPILKVLDIAGIQYKKDSGQMHTYTILKSDGKVDKSFKVSTTKNIATDFGGNNIKGGPFDLIGRFILGVDTQSNIGRAKTMEWFEEKNLIEPTIKKKEFKKCLKSEEIIENYKDLRLNGYKQEISGYLMQRGVSYEWIQKNTIVVGEVFKDIGYYDNYFCSEFAPFHNSETGKFENEKGDEPINTAVFLFPCYDKNRELVGLKARRKDGKKIRGKKSLALKGGKTGLIYETINPDTMIVVEGETDYIILRLMGYDNVIGNLGGVQSNRHELKSLLYKTNEIICLYDNDNAGLMGKIALSETLNRKIYDIDFPVREDHKGIPLTDINDLYKIGFDSKQKWDKLFSNKKQVGVVEDEKDKYGFIYLDEHKEFYDTKFKKYENRSDVGFHLGLTNKDLQNCIKNGTIKSYDNICYLEGGQERHYNTLDESSIVKHGGSEKAILHPHIEYLVSNICNGKQKNIDWVHKSILYKLTHINDVHIPALVLYGPGGSGKGTLLNLLSKIFGSDNVQIGLGQRDLESSFDSYIGGKLIVEYKEISSGHTMNDKKNLDRLKGMVCEDEIHINPKFGKHKKVKNIARFHLSSNHTIPIRMDSGDSGNRRWTIIKTGPRLNNDQAQEMNTKTFNNKTIVKQYISRLYETYPNVPHMTKFKSLNNEEKRSLVDACEGVGNLFFKWVEKNYPHIEKISNQEKNILLTDYCNAIGESEFDKKYKQTNFDLSLSHKYEKKTVSIRGKSCKGYYINKTEYQKECVGPHKKNYFEVGELAQPFPD